MHRRGINRDKQARVFEQCRKRQKIELRGKIEHQNVQFFFDGGEVRAFELVAAA